MNLGPTRGGDGPPQGEGVEEVGPLVPLARRGGAVDSGGAKVPAALGVEGLLGGELGLAVEAFGGEGEVLGEDGAGGRPS